VLEVLLAATAPPARGWAPDRAVGLQDDRDRPARAGMSPAPSGVRLARRWPPRPRGDEPRSTTPRPTRPPTAPPARGWALT